MSSLNALIPGYFFREDKALVPKEAVRACIDKCEGHAAQPIKERRAIPAFTLEGVTLAISSQMLILASVQDSALDAGYWVLGAAAVYATRMVAYQFGVQERKYLWRPEPVPEEPMPNNILRFDPCGAISKEAEYNAKVGKYAALELEKEQPFIMSKYTVKMPEENHSA